MSSSESPSQTTSDAARRERRRSNSLLLVLAVGFLVFGVAAGALYYALRPDILRIAVGPPGSDDYRTIQAMADAFGSESRTTRLALIKTEGAVESLALLGAGKADLAVGRGDLEMPAEAQTVAVVRKNFVVLWAPSGLAGKSSKRKPSPKIKEVADLAGRRVGVIGRTPVNAALLRVILSASGVQADKVAVAQFGTDQIEELARDLTLDAFMAVGPLDSKITSDAVAATARVRGEPKFLPIETSEAIALKHPRYETEEIPPSVFNADPAWPDDKVETVSVSHLIVARKTLSETTVAAFFRQLFAVRQAIARQVPGAAHITKPDLEKDPELQVHRGAAAVIDGNERTFLDRYGDYFWFGLLLLSGIGSAAAWLRRYLNRDERDDNTSHRKRILAMVSSARTAESNQELLALQREADAIIAETLECYDDGAIEEEELAAFGLVLDLLSNAIAERRAALQRATFETVRGAATGHGVTPRG
ncbi:ABC transporter substrate-binding protein [Bradyrhizobium sp. 180]|uniref:TAXI family TRAP transporter solute-binding subunit n=1 Tax=unclassified Bradyrhizobium TaxID=2631580 RepID=UPI001FFB9976|nr:MULTISPECIES: TAXI family TRAP transporter solute-binding subunit [unclassified Bradyrhizobium]MCK1422818.1 ABC transporter substrate-binding protein [Bradyrhizobium sp. CW12]MCK1492231.1 ABC transporter substrate-binding protein [Bradyrhizobium sp. 180]MCK1532562.1 ABC transporter substrate-binding protein [Bradyrhizobium sp. 182]MCK1598956.1 ABC transporter substrate-binding protein [Bradyrhizobium sp. 164]MCK1617379.1 ABC transporter substrate-binding protein [Bradyrhizobium sp. 159]